MVNNEPKIIFGGGAFWRRESYDPKFLGVIEELGVKHIDTAAGYGDSEELLGEADAPSRFVIDTKYPAGFGPTPSSKEALLESAKESLRRLKTDSVDVYYLHAPDDRAPLEDILEAINELYNSGMFKRFGLSNFTAEGVENVVRIAKERNYVLPSVYQGNYSAVARRIETEIFPVLRKHNFAFYAYSPIAGGFLTKTSDEIRNGGTGRWDSTSPLGAMYNSMYGKPSLLEALDIWNQIAKDEGISKSELSYRWITHNSALRGELGDGVIIGARNPEQLRDTLAGIKKGPLSAEVAKKIDQIWEKIVADAPLDNYHR